MVPSPFSVARAGQRLPLASASSSSTSSPTSCSLLAASLRLSQTSSATQTTGTQQIRSYKQQVPAEGPPIPSPTAKRPDIPPYPLGPRQLFKQSNKGLYGNARIRFGNNVSRETEVINPQKVRRKWWPNIQEKRLFSASLGVPIRTRVSTRVLRTIDKVGGLDAYLLGSKPARIAELGPWGWRLRWRIMQTPTVQEQFRQQRVTLGLPEEGLEAAQAAAEAARALLEHDIAEDSLLTEETQRMIDEEALFDMAPQEGFMAETDGKKSS
ncbi:50S ribosomal protein L24 [Sporothrix schenckii 1099-18]|uniref:50S ribosomal protein L24 n=1 Tax=Sporothrix schenckii 1099-18 TaxID=1397361 RepID=A0A0F2M061_SPOSC|nr:50S ribosomal protein L24 [Sporothrix schenckii 1099-18]KJR82150.1 50S ribosomal protein L24 [Sporothrix schenckii 1099-18]